MFEPLISIILPTYNGSRYLNEAIESCLEQTHSNWELIIVDDASTDSSPDIIENFIRRDNRVSMVRHENNKKLPAALNTGSSLAQGKYITWISDDNRYRPEALAAMLQVLQSDLSISIVYTDYTMIDENGNSLSSVTVGKQAEIVSWCCIGPSFLYRREVHETLGGYSEDLFTAEDYEFWLRASLLFGFSPLHRDLYLYRWHSNSLTQEKKSEIRLATEKALAKNLPKMKWLEPRDIAKGYLNLAQMALARTDVFCVRKRLWNAMRTSCRYTLSHMPYKLFLIACLGQRGTALFKRIRNGLYHKLAFKM